MTRMVFDMEELAEQRKYVVQRNYFKREQVNPDQLGTGKAPAGWTFDKADWWVEEYGRIMEKPDFPMPPGKYVVTGDREVTTVLTVDDAGGSEG